MLKILLIELPEKTIKMTDVFVIRNQLGHYWAKSKTWVDGAEARAVMRAKHEDDAINTLFELSSKDFELRGEVLKAPLSERGQPIIEASQIPLLEPEQAPPQEPIQAEATTDAGSGTGA